MTDLIIKEDVKIEDLIYEIRGKQVMFSFDLASIYQIETKVLNQVVKRNIERFPNDFCFLLTDNEVQIIWSQIVTKKGKVETRGGKYKNPIVFTEHGVIMLSGLLNSKVAVEVNILVVKAFVSMKKYISSNTYINRLSNVESKLLEHDNKINLILDKLNSKEEVNHIFYDGEIYDAYSLLIDILSTSKEEIIIIDNYAGKKLFDIIRNIIVNIKVYTNNIDTISKDKYEKQYSNLEIINTNIFHDRFILIDRKVLYHSGTSFKDLGKKCFAINKIEDINIINNLLDRLEEIND